MNAVERLYSLFKERDFSQLDTVMAEDIIWQQMDGFLGGGIYHGIRAIVEGVFDNFSNEWEDWQVVVESIYPSGDNVFVTGSYAGTHLKTGKYMTAPFVHRYWLNDMGKICRFQQYTDTAIIQTATDSQ